MQDVVFFIFTLARDPIIEFVQWCNEIVKLFYLLELLHLTIEIFPGLYVWYRWLDGKFPGTNGKTVAKKVFLDAAIMGFPFYSAFYIGNRKNLYFLFV